MAEELLIDPESVVLINTRTRKGEISIHNNSVNGKAFKIKTTKPNDYTVRPNIGIIHPLHKTQIEILAQDRVEVSDDHKFLIEVYQFDWRKNMNELRDFMKETRQQPMAKKLLGVRFVENDVTTKGATFTPKKIKDYVELVCLFFLFVQFALLCGKLFR